MINDTLYKRKYVIGAVILSIVLIYILRLFSLQIANTAYSEKADRNAFLRRQKHPSRGLIFDRNDSLLVFNLPAYDITLIMREMKEGFDTTEFCNALKIDRAFFDKRIIEIKNRKKNRGYSAYTPQIFLKQMSPESIAQLQQNIYQFPGTYIENRDLRGYNYPYSAHVLGQLSEVTRKRIEEEPYYRAGDYAGNTGIELMYEKQLRGEKGEEILLRDSRGRIQGSYNNGAENTKPIAGKDLKISIDIKLQQVAEQLLQNKRGSVVAIEPSTGEILAMASSPTWNPEDLTGLGASEKYLSLVRDKSKPLYNRATQAQYPPGSTFKINQALIALQEGVINEHTKFTCHAQNSYPIRCTHNHGKRINLTNAIEQSCNPYFWNTFRSVLEKNGYGDENEDFKQQYNNWRDYIISFGYGKRFENSDIHNQSVGYVPTIDFYTRYYGQTGWKASTVRSLSIGQGELLTTPLQMANSAAVVANEGYYITPHFNTSSSMKWKKNIVNIDQKHFKTAKEGMYYFFENTNAKYYKLNNVMLCGKTGTVQNPHGEDHSLFVGFAPMENPTIAIAVVIENAGFGAVWAMPIGSLIMEQHLNGKINRTALFDRLSTAILDENAEK